MTRNFKSAIGLLTMVIMLSACDVGTLNANYELTLNKDGTVSGLMESEFTPERSEWYERENNVSSAVVINELSYTYNVGSCQLEDVVINVAGADADGFALHDVSLANLIFENIDYPLASQGFAISTPENNPDLIEVRDTVFNTECVDPGAYVIGSGLITTTKRVNGPSRLDLGLNNWENSAEVNVAISNIHPADRPYFYALESMCASGDFGTCINPAELGDELLTVLDPDSEFSSAISTRWERGEFPSFLADNGFETYRTEDGGHGIRRYFKNQQLNTVFRNVESDYAAIPGWSTADGEAVVLDVKANFTNWLTDNDKIVNPQNESQLWQQESQLKTDFNQSLKLSGLILDSNGIYSSKTKKLTWRMQGFGTSAVKTAAQPQTTLIPGIVVTFKKNSSKLTAAAKKALKKDKALLRDIGQTRIVAITNSSLSPDKVQANETLATKRAAAIVKYLKQSLKLNFEYVTLTRPSSDSGSAWAKSSVNKAVISPFGIPVN